MADASFLQTSFLGGEWSPLVQGRMDDPLYKRSMNLCRNGLPIEEGAATRRPGHRLIAAMRKGAFGVLRRFEFKQAAPYLLELTAAHLRFIAGTSLVVDSANQVLIASISTANPAVIETVSAHGYTTGDQLLAAFDPGDTTPNFTIVPILGRELEITVVDTTHFSVKDAVTGASIDGSAMVLGESLVNVARIFDFTTSYTAADLQAVNTVQDQANLLLLHGSYAPYLIQNTSNPGASTPAIFNLGNAVFNDGPYFDPVSDGTSVTLSGTSGAGVTATLAGGATRFASTDVGRMVRFFSEPAVWAIGTAYTAGQSVKYNGAYYTALKPTTGKQPDIDVINWGVATGAAVWNWATITAVADATHATVTLKPVVNPDRTVGGNLTGTAIASGNWRLGLYSATTGYPTCGEYHGSRMWLSGVLGNRIDGSVSNGLPSSLNGNVFDFTPTAADGTVADNNACAFVFNSNSVNQIFWMESDAQGLLCGTLGGEWLVRASASNDNITPTSVDARRVSKFGSANVPSRRAGLPVIFVQRYNKKVLEYITTDFRGMTAHNISLSGKHLTQKGIVEIAYQREKVPVIWARTADGQLIGCTFKRESPFASDPADFAGWHAHSLPGMTVQSIQVGPSQDGTLDALSIVVQRTSDQLYYSLQLTDFFDVDYQISDGIFVDFASTPVAGQIITSTNPHVVRFYGLWRLAGQNVDVMVGGVDSGTIAVAADGHLDVPIDNGGLLTTALLQGLTSTHSFNGLGITIQLAPADVAATPASTGILEFDTSAGGDGNGNPFMDWDNPAGPRLFTSSAASGACAWWDMKATDTPPTRLAFHATNAVQGLAAVAMDSKGVIYLGAFTSLVRLAADLQSNSVASYASLSMSAPNQWLCVQVGGKDLLVSIGSAQLDVTDVTTPAPAHVASSTGVITEAVAAVHGRLRNTSSLAQLWVIGASSTSGGSYTRPGQNMGLYKATIRATTVSMRRHLDITPAMFGFTHFSANVDLLGDETDGNPIIWVQSSVLAAWAVGTTYNQYDCVSNAGHDFESLAGGNVGNNPPVGGDTHWRDLGVHDSVGGQKFIKINASTGAVMWTVTMVAGLAGYRLLSRVRFGKLRVLDPSAHSASNHWLWDINTLTGAGVNTPADMNNVSPSFAKQAYNDKTGQWIGGVSYAQLGVPAPIGHTASTFSTWAELGPVAGFSVPLIVPPNAATFLTVPAAIGYTYESDFQILRVIMPQEAGSQNGPALGKNRRTHHYAVLLQQTQGISFGTTFVSTAMHAASLTSPGGTPFKSNQLFSGVLWEPIEATSDFDNMICWKITRPFPATVCSVEGFLHTQDR